MLVSGDAEGARQAYQAVRDVELHIVAAAEGFANLALAAGDRTAALQHYLDAAKWDQVDPRYLTSAARIEMASGKAAKGEKLLRRALRKPWQNPRTWKHRPQKMPPCTLQRLAVCVIWVAMPERWRPTAGFWLSSAPITHVPLRSRRRYGSPPASVGVEVGVCGAPAPDDCPAAIVPAHGFWSSFVIIIPVVLSGRRAPFLSAGQVKPPPSFLL